MTATISGDGTSTLINLTTSGNTILGDASTDTLNVGNGGLVKDASGNVGIGTASTNLSGAGNGKFLTILGAGATTTAASGRIELANPNTPATENECGSILFEQVGNNSNVRIASIGGTTTGSGGANGFGGYLTFYTKGDNVAGAPSERARIDTSGNLLVGVTSAGGSKFRVNSAGLAGAFYVTAASTTATEAIQIVKFDNNSTIYQVFQKFYINDGASACGQINANGANTAAFGSTSDSRLKENIVDLPSQLDNIMSLRPVEFDYIESEGGGHQIGFIAQEVQAIYPDLVGERADGMLTLTDMNKNDARLIKAIQEMKAIIDTQASTITALQADVAALKAQP